MDSTGHQRGVGGVVADVTNLNTTTGGVSAGSDWGFAVTGDHPDASVRVTQLTEVIEVIQPIIEADGGTLSVLGVDVGTGVVRLQLAGACGSCAVSGSTLNDGIDRIIRSRIDWVTEIIGVIEESDVGGLGGWTPKGY